MNYNKDDKFIAKWKPISKVGIKDFLISHVISNLVNLSVFAITLLFVCKSNVGFVVKYCIFIFGSMILGDTFQWYRSERKYKHLLGLMKNQKV